MKKFLYISFILLVACVNVNSTKVQKRAPKQFVRKEIALTIDDLPVAVGGSTGSRSFVKISKKLVTTIQKYNIPATGFVNSRKIASQGKKLLNMWLEANLELGNHTHSHPDLNNTPIKRFKDNIIKGENGLKDLLEENGKKLKYFRYPCLHRGKTNRIKQEIERFLTERGYIIAPVTMDNQEWMFASVYAQAKRRNDTANINRIGREYLLHMKGIIEFFEAWSLEIVGYQPKHIFLIHANSLNADYLDKVIQILLKKGYSFVSLDEVMSDKIYSFKENYIGSEGLSWIHRIAFTQGIKLKREPREPAWLNKMYNDFSKGNQIQEKNKWKSPADKYIDAYKMYVDAKIPIPIDSIRNFVYFARDRKSLYNHQFLRIPRFVGAQIMYSWAHLEPEKGKYNFKSIQDDYTYLASFGKKLFIQLQDATFSPKRQSVPKYLLTPEYDGGAVYQRNDSGVPEGWVAKRWNKNVQARFTSLLTALGVVFDGKIEGINLQETSIGVTHDSDKSFSPTLYIESLKANMLALKESFPNSTTMQYANFLPGEWLPWDDKGYLRSIYQYGEEIGVGLGAPDLMVRRKGQLNHVITMMHENTFSVPLGIAVQDGNYIGQTNSNKVIHDRTNIVPMLYEFAKDFLKVKYIFWSHQKPYFEEDVLPAFANQLK